MVWDQAQFPWGLQGETVAVMAELLVTPCHVLCVRTGVRSWCKARRSSLHLTLKCREGLPLLALCGGPLLQGLSALFAGCVSG